MIIQREVAMQYYNALENTIEIELWRMNSAFSRSCRVTDSRI
mgnify:CR=1 FL=1